MIDNLPSIFSSVFYIALTHESYRINGIPIMFESLYSIQSGYIKNNDDNHNIFTNEMCTRRAINTLSSSLFFEDYSSARKCLMKILAKRNECNKITDHIYGELIEKYPEDLI